MWMLSENRWRLEYLRFGSWIVITASLSSGQVSVDGYVITGQRIPFI